MDNPKPADNFLRSFQIEERVVCNRMRQIMFDTAIIVEGDERNIGKNIFQFWYLDIFQEHLGKGVMPTRFNLGKVKPGLTAAIDSAGPFRLQNAAYNTQLPSSTIRSSSACV